MKRKSKQKKRSNARSSLPGKSQHDRNTIKGDERQGNYVEANENMVSDAITKADEVMADRIAVEVCSEQEVIEEERVVDISYKEHLIIVGIGVAFSIILYMVSFSV